MTKKPTMDEYRKMGIEFKQQNYKTVKLIVMVANKCGKKYANKMDAGHKKTDQVRSDIEELMFKHHPTEATTDIFYGKEGNEIEDLENIVKGYQDYIRLNIKNGEEVIKDIEFMSK